MLFFLARRIGIMQVQIHPEKTMLFLEAPRRFYTQGNMFSAPHFLVTIFLNRQTQRKISYLSFFKKILELEDHFYFFNQTSWRLLIDDFYSGKRFLPLAK